MTNEEKVGYEKLLTVEPQLFSRQLDNARWLFVPICDGNHWVLFAVNLEDKEIHWYNSLRNHNKYININSKRFTWLKHFLSWRFRKYL